MNKQKLTFKRLLYFVVFLFVGFSFVACEKTQDEPLLQKENHQNVVSSSLLQKSEASLTPMGNSSMRVSEASVLSSRGFHSATYKIFPPDIRRVSFDVNSAYGISILNEGPDPVDVFFEFLEPEGVDVGQRITLKKGQSWGGHRRGSGYCQFALQSLGGNVKVYVSRSVQ